LNTVFRVLVVALLALACVQLHEIAKHTQLAGTALAVIALQTSAPAPAPRPPASHDRVVRN
jgi:hypothetical protein